MGRLKLSIPATFVFFTTINVRITDLNYGGHVGNDTILSFLHEARFQYLGSLGYTELNVEGVGLVMGDVCIEFKAEAFQGDVLKAYVKVVEWSRAGFDVYYKLLREYDGKTIALAKTGMVCFDYAQRKVVSVPERFRMLIEQEKTT